MNHLVKMVDKSKPVKKCGFLDDDGQICPLPAGSGTNHQGTGYCRIHEDLAPNKLVAALGEDSEIGKAITEFSNLHEDQLFNLKNVSSILLSTIQQVLKRIDTDGYDTKDYQLLISSLKELRANSESGYKIILRRRFIEQVENYIKAMMDVCKKYIPDKDKLTAGEEMKEIPYFVNPNDVTISRK